MLNPRSWLCLGLVLALAGFAAGCGGDVGDSSAQPTEAGIDSSVIADVTAAETTTAEGAVPEASVSGADSEAGSPGPSEAAVLDDTGPSDDTSHSPEAGAADADGAAPVDAGPPDASPGSDGSDSGGGADVQDAQAIEVGADATPDDGPPDATAQDSGVDGAGPDANSDSQAPEASTSDSGSGLTPCTMAPCAAAGANSVKCSGSPTGNGVCTATEALFVAMDIASGLLVNGQPKGGTPQTESCYFCLNSKLCLDKGTTTTGQECGDVPTSAQNGPAGCLAVVSCTLAHKCATSNPDSLCYCGTAVGNACNTPGAADGPCRDEEAAAIGFPASDAVDITLDYLDPARAGGVANTIFACAFSNACKNCLP
jgi:hypothetical protein